MGIHYEKIIQAYKKLEPDTCSSWEVYAGERSQAMAAEQDISRSKWMEDRVKMQLGQAAMTQELTRELPSLPGEWKERLRDMVSRQIDSLLRGEVNDIARKGLLLQVLLNNQTLEAAEAGINVDEKETEALSRMRLPEMREKVIHLGVSWTLRRILPILHQQCDLLKQEPEQLKELLNNPAAMAVAGYMAIPEIRNAPSTAGAAAAAASHFQSNTGMTAEDVLNYAAMVLLAIAVGMAILALLSLSTAWLTAGATHLLVEGTFTGIAAAISQEMAFVGEFVLSMLKISLGSALVGGLSALAGYIFHTESTYQSMENTQAVDTTGHSHRVQP